MRLHTRMRHAAIAALLVLMLAPAARAQGFIEATRSSPGRVEATFTPLTTTGATGWYQVRQLGIKTHALTIHVTGTPDALSVTLQCSNNGGASSTSTIGTITTVTGAATTGNATCTHVRVNVGTITGGTAVQIFPVYAGVGEVLGGSVEVDLGDADVEVGAQPADAPHFVQCSNGTIASPCLVSGTVTANLGATDNAVLDDIADGIAVTGTVTVTDGGGALNVIVDSSAAITVGDGAGALNVICDSGCAGGTQYAEDAAHASGNTGTLALAVRNDAGTALAADGDNATLQVNSTGALFVAGAVSCSNCTGSGASGVDDAAFTVATDSAAPSGYLFDDSSPDSVNEGDLGLARMSANRVPYGIIRDAAGNERGALVTANNELLVELGAGAATIGAVTATNLDVQSGGADLASEATLADAVTSLQTLDGIVSGAGVNISQWAGAVPAATNPIPIRLSDGAQFIGLAGDHTRGGTAAANAQGPLVLGVGSANAVLPITVCNNVVVINTATSGNVELVALSGTTLIYVCSYTLTAEATVDVRLVAGTGTACATSEAGITGLYAMSTVTGLLNISRGSGLGMVTKTETAGDALCIELGGSVQVNGEVTYAIY